MFVGATRTSRSDAAWRQVYRALEHGAAKNACQQNPVMKKFPKDIEDFGNQFVSMQIKRHDADYKPDGNYYKSSVQQDICDAEQVIRRFQSVPVKDRRAFAAFVLLKVRKS